MIFLLWMNRIILTTMQRVTSIVSCKSFSKIAFPCHFRALLFSIRKIAAAICYHGRQNISLRGHRDTGRLLFDEPLENDGNFRAFLRQLCQHDSVLKEHLQSCNKNSTHTSWKTQNEILKICGNIIKVSYLKALWGYKNLYRYL